MRPLVVVVLSQLQHVWLSLYTTVGRAMSAMSILAARWRKDIVSLTHSFVSMIYNYANLREVWRCRKYFQEKGPSHRVMMWPGMEQDL